MLSIRDKTGTGKRETTRVGYREFNMPMSNEDYIRSLLFSAEREKKKQDDEYRMHSASYMFMTDYLNAHIASLKKQLGLAN